MSDTLGSGPGLEEREEISEDVCLRVTILEIGVVKNFEQAPAVAPTINSSKAGNVVAFVPFFCNLLVLR